MKYFTSRRSKTFFWGIASLALIFLSITIRTFAQNQNISNGFVFEGEPYLIMNPSNPKNLVVAWMGFVYNYGSGLTIKVRSSFDGGDAWSDVINMPHMASTYKSADPTMAFDGNGNLFLAYIDYREAPDSGGVYLVKSQNGGLTWSSPIKVMDIYDDGTKTPIDRPWLKVNAEGDKLYLTTKPAPWILPPNRAYFRASIDSGQTWMPWRYLDTTGYLIGNFIAQPMAAPACFGNRFFAVYPSFVLTQSFFPRYLLAVSDNSGASFSYHPVFNFNGSYIAANDSAKLGYQLICNPYDTNHLAFFFFYKPFGDIDLMMTETYDAGSSWSVPHRVNDDPPGNGRMQDLVWADFSPEGDIIVAWRDRRNAPDSGYATSTEIFAAYRHRDSLNFNPGFAISDSIVQYDPILAQKGNDFMAVELNNDTLYAAWGSTMDGSLDIWFVKVRASNGNVTDISLIASESPNISIFPNPSSTGHYRLNMNDHVMINEIVVFDNKGRNVFSSSPNNSTTEIDISSQSRGIYIISIQTAEGILMRTVMFNE